MFIHDIGETAGKIWKALSKTGATPVDTLARSLGADPKLVQMALGWLSREDKLQFEREGKSIVVRLKEGTAPAKHP